jgi:hypothetical protein
MKAQDFLNLVGRMMAAQQDYFTAKRNGDPKAKELLFRSKGIEKAVMNVVKEGRLEPDAPPAAIASPAQSAVEEHLKDLNFYHELERLDLFGNESPTDGQGEQSDEATSH